MNRTISSALALCVALLSISAFAQSVPPSDPVYIRMDDGWEGVYARENQYVQYMLAGSGVELQDAHHIMLRPGVGLMVTFAARKNIGPGKDLLEAHLNWELAYWRQYASRVESAHRDDLGGARPGMKVTELSVYAEKGAPLKVYMIALALNDGVLVFSVSPADKSIDPMVKALIGSIRVVDGKPDLPAEAKRIRSVAGNPQ